MYLNNNEGGRVLDSSLMSSFGMWLACGLMVGVIVFQSILYFRVGKKEAQKLGVPSGTINASIRAAAITSVGPTLSAAIVLLSLVITVGSPMAWMRLNDIGAARTELSVVALAKSILPATASADEAFTFASWGMALNNMGWMAVTLFATHRMGATVNKMNEKINPLLVKAVMGGASIGLFAYLLSNNLVGKKSPQWIAAFAAGVSIILMNTAFAKNQRLQELSLGIAMIIGMVCGSVVIGMTG